MHQDLFSLRLIDTCEDKKKSEELFQFYCMHRTMNFNPVDFLMDEDKLYFITGRDQSVKIPTEAWVKKYFPQATLIMTNNANPEADESLEKWYVRQSKKKAKALKENKIDVYFEDTPQVVAELRKLCPEIKVIQYGGRANI